MRMDKCKSIDVKVIRNKCKGIECVDVRLRLKIMSNMNMWQIQKGKCEKVGMRMGIK